MLVALALGLCVPTFATAQLGPTNVPAPLTQTAPSDDAVEVDDDGGLSTLQLVLIFGAAIGVIALIAWVIMRDARRAAPAAAKASPAGSPRTKSAREREREKARKRSKSKAAREQRKRNRPR